jgi:Ca2+-binding RTX toxin-like protein
MKLSLANIIFVLSGIGAIFLTGIILQQPVQGHEVVEGPEDFECQESGGQIVCAEDTQVHAQFVFRDEDGILRCDNRATEQADTLSSNCTQGRSGGDTLTVEGAHGHEYGDNGPDILNGGAGNDYLHGTNGNDQLDGKAGRDIMFGDHGDDTYTGGPGRDIIHCGPGRDTITDFSNDILVDYGVPCAGVTDVPLVSACTPIDVLTREADSSSQNATTNTTAMDSGSNTDDATAAAATTDTMTAANATTAGGQGNQTTTTSSPIQLI